MIRYVKKSHLATCSSNFFYHLNIFMLVLYNTFVERDLIVPLDRRVESPELERRGEISITGSSVAATSAKRALQKHRKGSIFRFLASTGYCAVTYRVHEGCNCKQHIIGFSTSKNRSKNQILHATAFAAMNISVLHHPLHILWEQLHIIPNILFVK